MKVLHVPYTYYPDPVGGTEVYVSTLARDLTQEGVASVVAAPGPHARSYTHDGLAVYRLAPGSATPDLASVYGAGDAEVSRQFEDVLVREGPDLVHLHALSPAASVLIARASRRARVPLLFTYHTPSVSCQRGSLLRWGADVCDGRMRRHTCSACTLHGHGVPRMVAGLMGHLPPSFGRLVARAGLRGSAWTAMQIPSLMETRHESARELFRTADRIIALAGWTRELLLGNGVPGDKVIVIRHGLPGARTPTPPSNGARGLERVSAALPPGPPVRIAFVGRLDPIKGADLLIRAVRGLPGAAIVLDLYLISQGAPAERYRSQLLGLAGDDPRISFRAPVPAEHVPSLLKRYHALAVPSRCLETGPLVVLQAFAAGTPVVGADLGGIAELVRHRVDGLLVAPDSVPAWRAALEALAVAPSLLDNLRQGVRVPRQSRAVAQELAAVYRALVRGDTSAPRSSSVSATVSAATGARD